MDQESGCGLARCSWQNWPMLKWVKALALKLLWNTAGFEEIGEKKKWKNKALEKWAELSFLKIWQNWQFVSLYSSGKKKKICQAVVFLLERSLNFPNDSVKRNICWTMYLYQALM